MLPSDLAGNQLDRGGMFSCRPFHNPHHRRAHVGLYWPSIVDGTNNTLPHVEPSSTEPYWNHRLLIMNTTQRKYAVKRATLAIKNRYHRVEPALPAICDYPAALAVFFDSVPDSCYSEVQYLLAKYCDCSTANEYRNELKAYRDGKKAGDIAMQKEIQVVTDLIMLGDAPDVLKLLGELEA
jgi:hypothetical protein